MKNWSGSYIDMPLEITLKGNVRIFDLAAQLHNGMPRHPHHPPFSFAMAKVHGGIGYKDGVTVAMEMFCMGSHVGTHVDGIGHVSKNGKVFGGRDVLMGDSGRFGLEAGSIEETPPLIGRGHLVDGPTLFGRELSPSDSFGPEEFKRWFSDHAEPTPGSIVLIRTGWMERYWPDSEQYIGLSTGLPGVSIEGAHWLSDWGIMASGSDTMNYEHKPSSAIINLPVHVHFLVEKGIHIMESMSLDILSASGVTDFTFFAAPLRLAGGTGSPIRPLALLNL